CNNHHHNRRASAMTSSSSRRTGSPSTRSRSPDWLASPWPRGGCRSANSASMLTVRSNKSLISWLGNWLSRWATPRPARRSNSLVGRATRSAPRRSSPSPIATPALISRASSSSAPRPTPPMTPTPPPSRAIAPSPRPNSPPPPPASETSAPQSTRSSTRWRPELRRYRSASVIGHR
ncbi:MAG: hypothetical protein AVDCRST_MAG18-5193, partial [uncultured Thermomicrobiales bacterium]